MIWAKSVAALDPYFGRWLRGTITRLDTSAAAEVDSSRWLVGRLVGGLYSRQLRRAEAVWPTGDLSGEMKLEIKLVESTAAATPS